MEHPMEHLNIAMLHSETSHQLTTFNLAKRSKTVSVPRGTRVTVGEGEGQGYISQLWITFPGWFWRHWDRSKPISQTILKTLILRIYWDRESVAAVEAPVADLFGNGLCRASNFTSRYFGMSSGGFFCKFPMPFRKGFRLEFENLDESIDTELFANVLYQMPEQPLPDGVSYFHAQFRTGRNRGSDPVRILDATGRGHYVGCVFSAQAEQLNYLSYLEAPEYVYIDEDWDIPRIVGTGLEDYFLGGWYFREGEFSGELHGLPVKDALDSSVAIYRIHEADAIRFTKRIRFEFVNPWNPDRLRPFAHSSAAFFYLDTPRGQGEELPDRERLICWYRFRNTDHLSIP